MHWLYFQGHGDAERNSRLALLMGKAISLGRCELLSAAQHTYST